MALLLNPLANAAGMQANVLDAAQMKKLEELMKAKLGAFVQGGVLDRLEQLVVRFFLDGAEGVEREIEEALAAAKDAMLLTPNAADYGPLCVKAFDDARKNEPEFKAFIGMPLTQDGWLVRDRLQLHQCRLDHAFHRAPVGGGALGQQTRVEWEMDLVLHMAKMLNIDIYYALTLWMWDKNITQDLHGSPQYQTLFEWAIKPVTTQAKVPIDASLLRVFKRAHEQLQLRLVSLLDQLVFIAVGERGPFAAQDIIRNFVFNDLNPAPTPAPSSPRTLTMALIAQMGPHEVSLAVVPAVQGQRRYVAPIRYESVDRAMQGVLLRLLDTGDGGGGGGGGGGGRNCSADELLEALNILLKNEENDQIEAERQQKLLTLLCVVLHTLLASPSATNHHHHHGGGQEYQQFDNTLFGDAKSHEKHPRGILGVCQIARVASLSCGQQRLRRAPRMSEYFQPRAGQKVRHGGDTDQGRWFDGMLWLAHCLLRSPALLRHTIGTPKETNQQSPQRALSAKLSRAVSRLLSIVVERFQTQHDGCEWGKVVLPPPVVDAGRGGGGGGGGGGEQYDRSIALSPFLRAVAALCRIADVEILYSFLSADTEVQGKVPSLLSAAAEALKQMRLKQTRHPSIGRIIELDALNMVDAVSSALVRLDAQVGAHSFLFLLFHFLFFFLILFSFLFLILIRTQFDADSRFAGLLPDWARYLFNEEADSDDLEVWTMREQLRRLQEKSRDVQDRTTETPIEALIARARLRSVASSVHVGMVADCFDPRQPDSVKWDEWLEEFCHNVFLNPDLRNTMLDRDSGPTALLMLEEISNHPRMLTQVRSLFLFLLRCSFIAHLFLFFSFFLRTSSVSTAAPHPRRLRRGLGALRAAAARRAQLRRWDDVARAARARRLHRLDARLPRGAQLARLCAANVRPSSYILLFPLYSFCFLSFLAHLFFSFLRDAQVRLRRAVAAPPAQRALRRAPEPRRAAKASP